MQCVIIAEVHEESQEKNEHDSNKRLPIYESGHSVAVVGLAGN